MKYYTNSKHGVLLEFGEHHAIFSYYHIDFLDYEAAFQSAPDMSEWHEISRVEAKAILEDMKKQCEQEHDLKLAKRYGAAIRKM